MNMQNIEICVYIKFLLKYTVFFCFFDRDWVREGW